MSALVRPLCFAALLLLASLAAAQPTEPPPPRGPADIINRGREAAVQRDMQRATMPAPASPTAPASPHGAMGANPHAAPRPLSEARANPDLPKGQVRARIVDEREQPLAGTPVRVGILNSDASRDERQGRTDANGYAIFDDLPVGDKQAYRVSVDHEGARYSSTPFRLGMAVGHDVVVRRLPVTHDDKRVVLYVGATSLELRDERLKVTQQARIVNVGEQTYAFPEGGRVLRLPEGFTALQTDDTMGDQQLSAAPEGLRMEGSFPPGEVTLLWTFDLPIEGSSMRFDLTMPFRTFAYRVLAEAPPGMALRVDGMPEPMEHEHEGRRILVTEVQRRVGETPLASLSFAVDGIPGPGPARWIAVGLALAVVLSGLALSRRETRTAGSATWLDGREGALKARYHELQAQRAAGEIGPEFHRDAVEALQDELALVLRERDRLRAASPKRRADSPQTPASASA